MKNTDWRLKTKGASYCSYGIVAKFEFVSKNNRPKNKKSSLSEWWVENKYRVKNKMKRKIFKKLREFVRWFVCVVCKISRFIQTKKQCVDSKHSPVCFYWDCTRTNVNMFTAFFSFSQKKKFSFFVCLGCNCATHSNYTNEAKIQKKIHNHTNLQINFEYF